MSHATGAAEAEIRALIEAWADAVRRHDLPAVLAHHADDLLMFDVPPPFQSRGLTEYAATWDIFFAYHQPGQTFDIETLEIHAGDSVAFAIAVMRCVDCAQPGSFPFRLTVGLTKAAGAWRIQHEHHSVPAAD